MNTPRTITLLERALFEATLADRGWKAAVLTADGEVGGTGPDHMSAWSDYGTRYEVPDHDLDDYGDREGFINAAGEFHSRADALLAWRRDYQDAIRKTGWNQRCLKDDPGDSCDLKVNLV